jgi:hypothetical protein
VKWLAQGNWTCFVEGDVSLDRAGEGNSEKV